MIFVVSLHLIRRMSAKQREVKAVRRLERNGDEQTDDLQTTHKIINKQQKQKQYART